MTAANTVEIGGLDIVKAVAADCGNLEGALRTEMKLAVDLRAARGAYRQHRLAKQEIEHHADAAGHNANEGPDSCGHPAARRIPGDIADHQNIQSRQNAPGKCEVETHAQRDVAGVMPVCRQHHPVKILHGDKRENRQRHCPGGHQFQLFRD